MSTPVDPAAPPPPGLSYPAAYWVGVLITAALAVIGAVEVGWSAGLGDALGLTPQAFAIISLVGIALGVVGRAFPNVQYTPARRNAEFSHAVNRLRVPKDVRLSHERLEL